VFEIGDQTLFLPLLHLLAAKGPHMLPKQCPIKTGVMVWGSRSQATKRFLCLYCMRECT